ncbi:hypothetical protein RQP46_005316 [Phenoliferia psychrophenolica]
MAPSLAIVGCTGLVGGHLLPSFTEALLAGKISQLRLLTTRPIDTPVLAKAALTPGITVHQVDFSTGSLEAALDGVGILVSAMGMGGTGSAESYERNKANLIEAAATSGVKVYVPSDFGTDHNTPAAKAIGSPMFEAKKRHHAKAEALGLKVIAIYNGLLLETAFSAWLGIDSKVANPTWTIPKPSHAVAFTSLPDLGHFVLSATIQSFDGATDIPSRLRIYSDLITLDTAADQWEQATGGTITRTYLDEAALRAKYEEIKPTLAAGMLGPAIPLLITQGAFDHGQDCANSVLLRDDWAFTPTSVLDVFRKLPKLS